MLARGVEAGCAARNVGAGAKCTARTGDDDGTNVVVDVALAKGVLDLRTHRASAMESVDQLSSRLLYHGDATALLHTMREPRAALNSDVPLSPTVRVETIRSLALSGGCPSLLASYAERAHDGEGAGLQP